MTVSEILDAVSKKKPMSRVTLYKYLDELKIQPVANVRQIPQHYPANTPDKILKRLGFKPANGHRRAA